MNAFSQWKELHDLFLSSVQGYLRACMALETSLSTPPQSSSSAAELESALLLVGKELATISAGGKQLQQASSCISRLRNRSATLVPINLLPLEILSRIFVSASLADKFCLFSTRAYSQRGSMSLKAITSTSVGWRLAAFATPRLWAHIDLVATGASKDRIIARAQFCLKHASGTSLVMHIRDVLGTEEGTPSDQEILNLTAVIAPHLRQLRSLLINLEHSNRDTARAILRDLLGNFDTLSELKFLCLLGPAIDVVGGDSYDVFPMLPSHNQLQALSSVRVLNLYRMHMNWAALFTLVSLSLI